MVWRNKLSARTRLGHDTDVRIIREFKMIDWHAQGYAKSGPHARTDE